MLMSYVLSRTLVPTMVHYLLAREAMAHGTRRTGSPQRFDRGVRAPAHGYGRWLAWSLQHRAFVVDRRSSRSSSARSRCVPLVGRDFFPTVDAGLIKLHVRGTPGTRIEETEKRIAAIERTIRAVIPPTRDRHDARRARHAVLGHQPVAVARAR